MHTAAKSPAARAAPSARPRPGPRLATVYFDAFLDVLPEPSRDALQEDYWLVTVQRKLACLTALYKLADQLFVTLEVPKALASGVSLAQVSVADQIAHDIVRYEAAGGTHAEQLRDMLAEITKIPRAKAPKATSTVRAGKRVRFVTDDFGEVVEVAA